MKTSEKVEIAFEIICEIGAGLIMGAVNNKIFDWKKLGFLKKSVILLTESVIGVKVGDMCGKHYGSICEVFDDDEEEEEDDA